MPGASLQQMSSTVSRVIRNIASNWVAIGINLVLSFFLAPFVVNKLGAALYGIWAVAMQFSGYLYLMDFGVRDSLIRYTAKYKATGNNLGFRRIISVALIIYFFVFLAAMLVTFLISLSLPHLVNLGDTDARSAQIAIFLIGSSIAVTFLFNIYGGIIQGLQRFDVANAIGIVRGITQASTIVIVLNSGGGIVELGIIQFTITFLNGLVSFFVARHLLKKLNLSLSPVKLSGKKLNALLRLVSGYSVYVFINNIGQKLIFASDAIVIALFMPVSSVTFYAIAGNLIEYLRTLLGATAQVFNPMASEYSATRNKDSLNNLMLRATRLTLVIALPVIISYIILGEIFIDLWMGPEFAVDAAAVLLILAITQIFSSPHNSIASILYGTGKHKTLAFMRIGEGISNVILSVILVGPLGIVGVAIGTAIPHIAIMGIALPIYTCRLLGIPLSRYIKESMTGPLLNTIPFVIGALLIREFAPPESLLLFFVGIAGLCAVYAVTGYYLCINKDERALVNRKLRQLFKN